MSTEPTADTTDTAASRQIVELTGEGASFGYTAADGTMAGCIRTLGGAAEAAAMYQLGHRQHPDLADAWSKGTAGDALSRAVDADAARTPAERWAWWYAAQRGETTPPTSPAPGPGHAHASWPGRLLHRGAAALRRG